MLLDKPSFVGQIQIQGKAMFFLYFVPSVSFLSLAPGGRYSVTEPHLSVTGVRVVEEGGGDSLVQGQGYHQPYFLHCTVGK